MDSFIITMIVLAVVIIIAIVVILVLSNNKKKNYKKQIDDLGIRFNRVKTVPLAFKLNRAQTIAKKSREHKEAIDEYYQKYEEAQKHIDEISQKLNDLEDAYSLNKLEEIPERVIELNDLITNSEEEVKNIDSFLEKYSEKENSQREFSTKLKDNYRQLKLYIYNNAQSLSISYDGFEKKLEEIEELFSTAEEWMYANDYNQAQASLDKVENKLHNLKVNLKDMKEYIQEEKGVLPVMIDECSRKYALHLQRGFYLDHLNIPSRMDEIKNLISKDTKTLSNAEIKDVKEHIEFAKNEINKMIEEMDLEYNTYNGLKKTLEEVKKTQESIDELFNYVKVCYEKNNERFDLSSLSSLIETEPAVIKKQKGGLATIEREMLVNLVAPTELLNQINPLVESINTNKKELLDYKKLIDKNTIDEQRAKNQLMKLQVVMNDVETKIIEYHLPNISESYQKDLIEGREKIKKLKALLAEIPLNIEELNTTLDDAIKFIYTFYNNANNIVGMAIMVENAIVFGNKYRSSYPEIDQELSRAEFSYLNGEYTKALTMAITCMEKLFPDTIDEKLLENAQ